MNKTFSFDAEVNGLYGFAFAIAVVVRICGVEVARFEGRIPDSLVTDPWCIENVLPAIADMRINHMTSEELEEAFWAFWMEHKKNGATVIAHCGSPVESGLFRRCVERDLEARKWDGPYPAIHDVATPLLLLGERADSVDSYVEKHKLEIPFKGSSHHPLYDAIVAAEVWEHALLRLK